MTLKSTGKPGYLGNKKPPYSLGYLGALRESGWAGGARGSRGHYVAGFQYSACLVGCQVSYDRLYSCLSDR